jgi:hypothetical protein
LRALRFVEANECGLASHRQAGILRFQVHINAMRHRFNVLPSLIGERFGGPRRIVLQPANGHGVVEVHLGGFDRSIDGRRGGNVGRADQRDVTFAGEQTRGWIHPDPTRAG